jgi:hypothetical protein
MYDHAGSTAMPQFFPGFEDMANGMAFLSPDTGVPGWNTGRGATFETFGATLGNEYGPHMTTVQRSVSPWAGGLTGSTVAQNIPASLQGNASYTIAGVFRYDGGQYGKPGIWMIGNGNATTSVSLNCDVGGANLELAWGGEGVNRWRFNSGFTITPGNWYFVTATVQANGDTPVAHLWVGVGGSLIDKIAGVAYASTGGTPTKTPNVSAAPLGLNMIDGNQGNRGFLSYASLFVYSRPLGQAEVGLMYNTMKTNMTVRGVTVQ